MDDAEVTNSYFVRIKDFKQEGGELFNERFSKILDKNEET